jgi:hypothetical protein
MPTGDIRPDAADVMARSEGEPERQTAKTPNRKKSQPEKVPTGKKPRCGCAIGIAVFLAGATGLEPATSSVTVQKLCFSRHFTQLQKSKKVVDNRA